MEAQLERADHQHHEETGFHSGGEREKKSVLKKVKEKAKKIKNTIKKHSHAHDDAPNHHQVDASSMCESTVIRSKTLSRDENNVINHEEEPRINKPQSENEDPHSPNNTTTPLLDRSHNLNINNDDHRFEEEEEEEEESSATVVDKAKNAVASTFTPGDEDKALSEVITGALDKQKEAVQVLWSSETKTKTKPQRGKVSMSKEVAERLGPAEGCKREGEDALAAGEESSGKGLTVTDKIQDAFTSWLGKSDGIQTAQDSLGNAFVNNNETSGANVETHRGGMQ